MSCLVMKVNLKNFDWNSQFCSLGKKTFAHDWNLLFATLIWYHIENLTFKKQQSIIRLFFQENVGSSDKLSEVENKVRGTRKLFKEFKSFLTDYLKQIDPVESGENGGHLGHLLQVSDCLRSINQLVIEIFTLYFNCQCSKLLIQLIELYFLNFVSGDVDVFPRMY